MPKRLIGCLVILALLAMCPAILDEYTVRVLNGAIIAAIAVMGLNFAFGYSGLMSMSQASFMGISAYLLAILTTRYGMNVWLAVLVAVLVTTVFVIAAGRVLLKLRGHYLALGTLGLNVSLTIIMLNWVEVTGGSNGRWARGPASSRRTKKASRVIPFPASATREFFSRARRAERRHLRRTWDCFPKCPGPDTPGPADP